MCGVADEDSEYYLYESATNPGWGPGRVFVHSQTLPIICRRPPRAPAILTGDPAAMAKGLQRTGDGLPLTAATAARAD